MLFDILSLDFAQRALFVGMMAGVVAGILGSYVVAGRHAVFSDMLAHTSLAGVGIGLFFNISPLGGALIIACISAYLLWLFSRQKDITSESITMVFLSGGLALALLFAHFAKDNPLSLETFLFGSILTVRPEEVWYFALASVGILLFLTFFGGKLKTIVLDPVYAESRFRSSKWIELGFLLSMAILVGLSLKVVGGLLIGALLVIPVVISQMFCGSFRLVMFWSVIWNIIAIILGIALSFWLDVPTGSAIVLTLIGELFLFVLTRAVIRFLQRISL